MDIAEQLRAFFATRDDVAAAWLFGSQARGTARKDSDVDVAVLFKAKPEQVWGIPALYVDLVDALGGRGVDLVVANTASADLMHRVLRDGVLVDEHDKSARVRFEVRANNEYFDLLPMMQKYREPRT